MSLLLVEMALKGHPILEALKVDRIRQLYLVEKTAHDLSDAERTALREEQSRPLLKDLRAALRKKTDPIAKALAPKIDARVDRLLRNPTGEALLREQAAYE